MSGKEEEGVGSFGQATATATTTAEEEEDVSREQRRQKWQLMEKKRDAKEDVDNDYKYSRENYYNLIERGQDAIQGILDIAGESQHPRAYEVLAKLIKDTSDVSNQLLTLHKQKKDLDKTEVAALPAGQTTNNVFVGSTTDLQRMLKDINNEKEVAVDYDAIDSGHHEE